MDSWLGEDSNAVVFRLSKAALLREIPLLLYGTLIIVAMIYVPSSIIRLRPFATAHTPWLMTEPKFHTHDYSATSRYDLSPAIPDWIWLF